MPLPNNPQFPKFSILFILLTTTGIVCAQKEINTPLSILDKDQELLERAQNYIEEEHPDREKAFTIGHDVLKRTTSENNKILAHKVLVSYHYYKYATDSALFYAKKAVQLIGNKQDTLSLKSLSYFYLTLSNASRDKNLLNDCKKWALKGIETAQKSEDHWALDKLTISLASSYRRLGDVHTAIELLESILEEKENADLYESIALCYMDIENYAQALFYHKKALDYYYSIDHKRSIAIALLNIGAVYLEMKKGDDALPYLNKSLRIAREYNYPLIVLNNLINIGEVYQNKKEFKKAKKMYTDVLAISKESGYLRQQIYVYQNLKDIALEEKEYKEALGYTEKKNQLQDSINTLQKDKEIAKLEVEYETLKKEKEITVLKKNQEFKVLEIERQQSQKSILTYAFILILIPLIGLLFLYYQKLKNQNLLNKNQKEIGEQKIDALIRDQELKLIRTSISVQNKERKRIAQELHDRIGGNLAAIKLQFSSVKEGSENLDVIYKQLDDTYKQVRILSHDLIPEKFKHSNFTYLLKEYMGNIGKAGKLDVNIVTYQGHKINEIDPLFHNELFSVFQELITNTMKHANASNVAIQIDLIGDSICIIYEDNGKGYDTSVATHGIGVSNMKNRIQNLSGTMDIDSQLGRGTIFNIELPIPLTIS
ncbi:tetratricopeptide repeat-containing sensor histidine kinase [uncultured Aquimarina sp.]|uniref:ATP-binding protein n=1 Tax=uncultured Aquimarina sp. TaxID=575652 RepID=UPI002617A05A|nr:tetratricopeptide repeat-containing sensor histidine kinase [uncultured Aquimarina sp.]